MKADKALLEQWVDEFAGLDAPGRTALYDACFTVTTGATFEQAVEKCVACMLYEQIRRIHANIPGSDVKGLFVNAMEHIGVETVTESSKPPEQNNG